MFRLDFGPVSVQRGMLASGAGGVRGKEVMKEERTSKSYWFLELAVSAEGKRGGTYDEAVDYALDLVHCLRWWVGDRIVVEVWWVGGLVGSWELSLLLLSEVAVVRIW